MPLAFIAHTAFVLASLLIYAVSTHTSGQRRHPSAAVAWVLTIALLPYIGLPLFLVLGQRKFVRPTRQHPPYTRALDESLTATAIATLEGMGLKPPTMNRCVRFHQDGSAAWDEFENLVRSARVRLDICTFVLGNDALGERVVHLLEERASSGVRVRLLLDAVGSWRTASAQVRRLRAAGVQVRWYMPILRNPLRGRLNLRNHRKLVIADNHRLWTGGRNLAGEYFAGRQHETPWTDFSFTVEGALVLQSQQLFESHWLFSQGHMAPGTEVSAASQAPVATPEATTSQPDAGHRAQLVPSGPDQAEDTFYGLLLTTLYRAQHRVRAVTPYFVPDDSLLKALCLAARRGVQVELVLPARSNHRLADIARARAVRDLVAAGGRVQLAPFMVHAKVVVIDDALALGGSLNLDSRSLFLNFELMVAFYSPQDVAAVSAWIDTSFSSLPAFDPPQPSLLRDIAEGLVRWLGFQI